MRPEHHTSSFARAVAVAVAVAATLASPAARAEDAPGAPTAAASPAAPPTTTTTTSAWSDLGRIPALTAGGLAVVALGTGVVFGAISVSDHSSFDSHPTAATANAGESHELTADMCFGAAATLAVASLVMFLTHEDSPPPPQNASRTDTRISITPVFSPRASGVVVRF